VPNKALAATKNIKKAAATAKKKGTIISRKPRVPHLTNKLARWPNKK